MKAIDGKTNDHDLLEDALDATGAKVGEVVSVRGWGMIHAEYERLDSRNPQRGGPAEFAERWHRLTMVVGG